MLNVFTESLLKFTINALANTLPSPHNLRRWGIDRNAVCGLCGHIRVTLNHILAGCPYVRNVENKMNREDRVTWRHNCVLLEVARQVSEFVYFENSSPVICQMGS